MTPVATVVPILPRWRMGLLRLAYLIIAAGLAVTLWPAMLDPGRTWPLSAGVVNTMLTALSLLALIGLFRPVEMLPALLFEVLWKLIWLVRIAWPAWRGGPLSPAMAETLFSVGLIVPFLPLIPWDLVWRRLVAAPH